MVWHASPVPGSLGHACLILCWVMGCSLALSVQWELSHWSTLCIILAVENRASHSLLGPLAPSLCYGASSSVVEI